jgi:hypothetical protein
MISRTFLILILILTTLKVVGQVDSTSESRKNRSYIDSLSHAIDNRNPKYHGCKLISDSLLGEKIVFIKTQVYKGVLKYSIKTNRSGKNMDIKLVNLYIHDNKLIKANVYYSDSLDDFRKMLYFKNNICFHLNATHGMRMAFENGEEYVEFAEKLLRNKRIKD